MYINKLKNLLRLNTAYKAALSVVSADTIEIMAPLIKCPNAPGENGRTPIHEAARYGHIEIVKILASLTDNPNVPNKSGQTPCSFTKNAEIRGILYSKT